MKPVTPPIPRSMITPLLFEAAVRDEPDFAAAQITFCECGSTALAVKNGITPGGGDVDLLLVCGRCGDQIFLSATDRNRWAYDAARAAAEASR